jgi:hypothetical protein
LNEIIKNGWTERNAIALLRECATQRFHQLAIDRTGDAWRSRLVVAYAHFPTRRRIAVDFGKTMPCKSKLLVRAAQCVTPRHQHVANEMVGQNNCRVGSGLRDQHALQFLQYALPCAVGFRYARQGIFFHDRGFNTACHPNPAQRVRG